jgi:hypothetical protein
MSSHDEASDDLAADSVRVRRASDRPPQELTAEDYRSAQNVVAAYVVEEAEEEEFEDAEDVIDGYERENFDI